MALYLTEADVRQLLTMDLALDAVEAAHRAHGVGRAIDIPRQRSRTPVSALHILQGAVLDDGVIGYKAYTTAVQANRFLVHLFDAASGAPTGRARRRYARHDAHRGGRRPRRALPVAA